MAALSEKKVALLRVRLFDFQQRVLTIRKTIDDQVFAGAAFTANQRSIKARYDLAAYTLNQNLNRLAGAIQSGSLDGELLTTVNAQALVGSFDADLSTMQQAMADWNASSPIGIVTGTLGSLFSGAFASLEAMSSAIGTTASFMTWLPWVVLGAIVIPPVLRIIIKARQGGANAALQEANDSIEAGKERVRSTASAAARTAVTAAKFLI